MIQKIFLALFLSHSFSFLLAQAKDIPAKEEKTPKTEGNLTQTRFIPIGEAESDWKLNFYGFVKADYIYSSKATLSYGRENLQAPNQVKRGVQRDDYTARHSIQLQDTRLGFKGKYKNKIMGAIELDFINFDQSNPNVNVRPRLRQAYVEWDFAEGWQFFIGQKWDIFSPLNPDTYNTINSSFYSGNAGWMREQMGVGYSPAKNLRIQVAAGNNAVNVQPYTVTTVERNPSPSLATQIRYIMNTENTFYISGIMLNKLYYDPDTDPALTANKALFYDGNATSFPYPNKLGESNKISRQVSGLSLAHEYKASDSKIRLKWEVNWGKNLGDINTLTIGNAQMINAYDRMKLSRMGVITGGPFMWNSEYSMLLRNRTEIITIEESGAWFSVIYKFLPTWELGIFLGVDKIANQKDLAPAYTPASTSGTTFRDTTINPLTTSMADQNIWTPTMMGRMRENSDIGYHLTYLAEQGLSIFFQHEYMQTLYKDADRNKGILAHIKSLNLETGDIVLQDVTPGYMRASARTTAHVVRFGTKYSF